MTLSRLIITTGGTAGHIFPALAVALEARRKNPNCALLFIGGNGPERELAAKAKIDFANLPARAVMGKGVKGLLTSAWILPATWKASRMLSRFKPEAVIGFGGYAGFCPVLAARLKGLPTAVHEQNSVPGATNRILGKLVRRVFLSFPDTGRAFPAHKCELTGNPVRGEIFQAAKATRGNRHLLILGGSQGAMAINDAVIQALPELQKLGVKIMHQAGVANEQRVKKAYASAGWNPDCVHGFIEDMSSAYAWADLTLCRSGASTLFEVAAAGLPAVFVPFPHATGNHQAVNAKAMQEAGAALMLEQTGLNGTQVAITVKTLLSNTKKLNQMGEAARAFARPGAAKTIVDSIEAMVRIGRTT